MQGETMIRKLSVPGRPALLRNGYLDSPAASSLDKSFMLRKAGNLGQDLVRSWQSTPKPQFEAPASGWQAIVVTGMGGSATAGDYLSSLAAPQGPTPVIVNKGMNLPGFVGPKTPVICCSHSGDTEETLACYKEARARGAPIFALRAGGELDRLATADNVAGARIGSEQPPRAALGQSFGAILRAGEGLGIIPETHVGDAAVAHGCLVRDRVGPTIETDRNPAKQVAHAIRGRFVLVLAAEHLTAPAERFKNQLAENGKAMATAMTLPEVAHNTVSALETARDQVDRLAVVTLESRRHYPTGVSHRFDLVVDAFASENLPVHRIRLTAESRLSDLLEATAWGDFVSCYVGLLNGVDPTPIERISVIREALREDLLV